MQCDGSYFQENNGSWRACTLQRMSAVHAVQEAFTPRQWVEPQNCLHSRQYFIDVGM